MEARPKSEPKAATVTCKKILVHNGNRIALPFAAPKPPDAIPPAVTPKTSLYRETFSNKQPCSSGSTSKPLEPYHPNAHRSRNKVEYVPPKPANYSQIDFKSPNYLESRRFLTSNKVNFTNQLGIISDNQGINSEKTKWLHHLNDA
eukprot:GILI01001388.1.p1 GENE.GILI01001388.1~~GILI01001388.1.p1  ORF type:complete len:146 (+),score=34.88 GILI01001388.1:75-512(+)